MKIWTVLDLLNWTTDYFKRKGIESPRLEAELLLAHALGWQRVDLYARHDEVLGADRRAPFKDMVARRARHEPTQHILGKAWFYDHEFAVDERVLIPRSETEALVDLAVQALGAAAAPATVLDVGTGSGCIAISVALVAAGVRVLALDTSADALDVARANAETLGVADRVEFRLGDVAAVSGKIPPVDVLVANPPYVREDELPALAPEVRDHDPVRALVSGPTGLEVIGKIAAAVPAVLKPGGKMFMEIGEKQRGAVDTLLREAAGLRDVRFHKDIAGHDRVVEATVTPTPNG